MIRAFRLHRWAISPKDTTGSRNRGGRWNPPGTSVLYTSATASLGALEILVHSAFLPVDYAVTEISIPDGVSVEEISAADLPAAWDDPVSAPETQDIGLQWVQQSNSAVLSVPSAVVSSERNFILNPAHSGFSLIEFFAPQPFSFDKRLKPSS